MQNVLKMQEEHLSSSAWEKTSENRREDPAQPQNPQPSPLLPGLLWRRRSGAALRPQRACSDRLRRSRPAAAAAAAAAVAEEVSALHSTPVAAPRQGQLPPDAWRASLSPYYSLVGSWGCPRGRRARVSRR